MSEDAVLNANYLQAKLKKVYEVPHDRTCMHEFVLEGHVAGRRASARWTSPSA